MLTRQPGCVLYEAVACSRAFAGPSTIETLHPIANVDPAVVVSGLTSAPPELRRIVGKCLANGGEMARELMLVRTNGERDALK
jgi:hypothetical protein